VLILHKSSSSDYIITSQKNYKNIRIFFRTSKSSQVYFNKV